jgi:F-type H+-transporting ATPase subunit b
MILSRLTVSAISICGFLLASEGSGQSDAVHEGGWMEKWLSFDPGLFMWTIVTFLIVLMLLKWKAWGPLMSVLDKRAEDIKNALSAADRAKEDAEKASQDYEKLVQKARIEGQQIIADSKAAGEKVKNDIESVARENAEKMIGKAKTQIEAESQKALQEIKSSVVDLSIEAAEKIIEKNLDSEDNRKLVEKTLDSMGQA